MIEIGLNQYANDEHVLVKFRGISDVGNNIYIDDIQISGPLGISDAQQQAEFSFGPNPMTDLTTIVLDVANAGNYDVAVTDLAGKQVAQLHSGTLGFGTHRFDVAREQLPSAGVYLIEVRSLAGRSVQKLVVQ